VINLENRLLYIFFWPLLLFLAASIFTIDVVLGTYRFSTLEAAVYSGFWITFLAWVIWDFIKARGISLKNKILAITVLWLANSAGVWIVARFAHITGLGISSYRWALLLGLVVALAQGTFWTNAKKTKKRR
jgi:O-antigen ligase